LAEKDADKKRTKDRSSLPHPSRQQPYPVPWDPKSWSADPMYFVDSGRPLTGAPPLLKTRRHMRRDAARKLWRKLQEQGWRQVKAQWGEGVDP